MDKDQKSEIAKKEEMIASFWKRNTIFDKTLQKKTKDDFVFYDGPPFATGLPHYGHILAGIIKDVIPRYQTMRGKYVKRRWGWDCHGLPLENLIEQELKLNTKKDIEKYGIGAFNARARGSVLRYADDWRKIIPRTGRWVDMDRDYQTMDWTYTESVWWVFETLWKKKLIYEGFKSMHLCPRCETTLSNFEVNQGYKEIKDFAVTVKLKLKDTPNTSLLVWTTTPWTLPGNMAAAIHRDATYVKVRIKDGEEKSDFVILAKKCLENVLSELEYEVVEEFSGEKLIGTSYIPPFNYFVNKELENKKNAWKIYHAPYVSLSEGTGAVHLAPAFGEEDMELAEVYKIPLVHHVLMNGRFTDDVIDFKNSLVKEKDNHQATDVEIIKYLAHSGLLFKKEKISHSYPHCWRCDTPLLNYAASSWFVAVSKIREKLVKENKKITWIPKEVGEKRFGNWLLGARDWSISRSRYWGAPLPVWRCLKCENKEIIGSLETLKKKMPTSGNTYFIARHGEAESNKKGVVNSGDLEKYGLTEEGRKQAKSAGEKLKGEKIDIIIHSPFRRTRETAKIIQKELRSSKNTLQSDDRLMENDMGILDGKTIEEYHSFFTSLEDRFSKTPLDGENLNHVKRRTTELLYELESKYKNKTILLVSHSTPLWMLSSGAHAKNPRESVESFRKPDTVFIETGEVQKIEFTPLPHNENYELDLHRPYIDNVILKCECEGEMHRTEEVFDCWFESGSMPYGENHYPYENLEQFNPKKEKGFPADFIAEGLDQTRGWFYSLLVLSIALFGKRPYQSVVVNGLILAEDGKKMSKKLKNYPDPISIIDRYSADALRYYLLASPVVRGEDLCFSEKGVKEIQSKVLSRLYNVCVFYELSKKSSSVNDDTGDTSREHVLDTWIKVRFTELVNKVTYSLDQYELDRALRPIMLFIDDLSTWYVRRSRERLRLGVGGDRDAALRTLEFILKELSKVIAPFTPFAAEVVYQKFRNEDDPESVHLTMWPHKKRGHPVWPNPLAFFERIFGTNKDFQILKEMEHVRFIVSAALEARSSAGIKVRQPLSKLKIKNRTLEGKEELLMLIKDEVNVKKIVFQERKEDDVQEVEIDTNITSELKKEGDVREIIRFIQGMRKSAQVSPDEDIVLLFSSGKKGESLIREFETEIKTTTKLITIQFQEKLKGEELVLDDTTFIFLIER